jgi:hypothetical protein
MPSVPLETKHAVTRHHISDEPIEFRESALSTAVPAASAHTADHTKSSLGKSAKKIRKSAPRPTARCSYPCTPPNQGCNHTRSES